MSTLILLYIKFMFCLEDLGITSLATAWAKAGKCWPQRYPGASFRGNGDLPSNILRELKIFQGRGLRKWVSEQESPALSRVSDRPGWLEGREGNLSRPRLGISTRSLQWRIVVVILFLVLFPALKQLYLRLFKGRASQAHEGYGFMCTIIRAHSPPDPVFLRVCLTFLYSPLLQTKAMQIRSWQRYG